MRKVSIFTETLNDHKSVCGTCSTTKETAQVMCDYASQMLAALRKECRIPEAVYVPKCHCDDDDCPRSSHV